MALTVVLVPSGSHHASTDDTGGSRSIALGAGVGNIAVSSSNALLQVALPFPAGQWTGVDAQQSFADQLYVQCQSIDGNIASIVADATPVVFPANSPPLAQFRCNVTGTLPALVQMLITSQATVAR